jgi:hypothetical protein
MIMTVNASSESAESNPLSALGEALEAAAESVGNARAEATENAKLAAAKVQSGVSSGAYYAAYGISYGLIFSGVFVKELLPPNNPIRRGFEDGAVAAFDAAAHAVRAAVVEEPSAQPLEPQAAAVPPPPPPAGPTAPTKKPD